MRIFLFRLTTKSPSERWFGKNSIPYPIPPADPLFALTDARIERIRNAEQELGRLELAGEMVPSLDWFIYAFVRKEAVISPQIEGTQATLVDLLAFEAEEQNPSSSADIEEICNYLDALSFARVRTARTNGTSRGDDREKTGSLFRVSAVHRSLAGRHRTR